MSFAISREEMAAAFGADRLISVSAERLNPAVTHAPTVAFLSGVGLPDVPGSLFAADDDLAAGMTGAAERKPYIGDYTDLPFGAWVVLGYFMDDAFLLDGATGVVRVFNDGQGAVQSVNSGVDFFARFLAELPVTPLASGSHREVDLLHRSCPGLGSRA